jgi:hypothetical protein
MFGLRTEGISPLTFIVIMMAVTNAGAALLLLVGALSKTFAMGNALATLVLVFASLVRGRRQRGGGGG